MTKSPTTYHVPPALTDPQIDQICERIFHRAISAKDGAALLTELMHRRFLEWRSGWMIVDSGNGWVAYAQEDELP